MFPLQLQIQRLPGRTNLALALVFFAGHIMGWKGERWGPGGRTGRVRAVGVVLRRCCIAPGLAVGLVQ